MVAMLNGQAAALVFGVLFAAAPAPQTRIENISAEAASDYASSQSAADRQARQRAKINAREACRQDGGRPTRVTAKRISVERVTATKHHARWRSTLRCEYPAAHG